VRRLPRGCEPVRLYVETMDATLVELGDDGRVRFDSEEWSTPTLQERRAIIHAANEEIAELTELIDTLERQALR
jgi:hypothetical protein